MATRVDLCTEFKIRTKKEHDNSDRHINLKLALVLTDTTLYGNAIADFLLVFETIEQTVKQYSDHPHVSCLNDNDMLRTSAFEQDLIFYLGRDWRKTVKHSDAARKYCDRILKVSEKNPTILLA